MQSIVHRTACAVLLMSIPVAPVAAQGSSPDQVIRADHKTDSRVAPDKDPEVIETLDEQLVSLLESGTSDQQSDAMKVIINLRRQRPEAYSFTSCIPSLVQIYRSDREEGERLLALMTLNAIGTARAYEALRQTVENIRSERIRRQTALVLMHTAADESAS